MKLAVTYPDPEPVVVDRLTDLFDAEVEEGTVTVGVGRPDGWTPGASLHVQVAWDGTPRLDHPVAAYPTMRITVHGAEPGPVKDLALLAQGLLLAEPMMKPLTGVLPTRDADGVELASFTVRFANRSQPVEAGS